MSKALLALSYPEIMDTGYNETLQEMTGQSLQVYRKHHDCHRLTINGELKLDYTETLNI